MAHRRAIPQYLAIIIPNHIQKAMYFNMLLAEG